MSRSVYLIKLHKIPIQLLIGKCKGVDKLGLDRGIKIGKQKLRVKISDSMNSEVGCGDKHAQDHRIHRFLLSGCPLETPMGTFRIT